jgi:hypothetical protein
MDDLGLGNNSMSLTTGNSGARIGWGVIGVGITLPPVAMSTTTSPVETSTSTPSTTETSTTTTTTTTTATTAATTTVPLGTPRTIVGVVAVSGTQSTPVSGDVQKAVALVAIINADQCNVVIDNAGATSATAAYRVYVEEQDVAAVQSRLMAQVQTGTLINALRVHLWFLCLLL